MNTALYEVDAQKLNDKLASELKEIEEFAMPQWAYFVKTSVARARPPMDYDFWYQRAASVLRQVYVKGTIGVNRLRTRYGGRKDNGMRPPRFRKGSGKILRIILQQAEKAGFLEKVKGGKGRRSGRRLTDKGRVFLEETAKSVR